MTLILDVFLLKCIHSQMLYISIWKPNGLFLGLKKYEVCRHKACWDKEGEWIYANKEGIRVNKTTVIGSSKQLGSRQRRSAIAGDKYSAKYLAKYFADYQDIRRITIILCALPWYLSPPCHCSIQGQIKIFEQQNIVFSWMNKPLDDSPRRIIPVQLGFCCCNFYDFFGFNKKKTCY